MFEYELTISPPQNGFMEAAVGLTRELLSVTGGAFAKKTILLENRAGRIRILDEPAFMRARRSEPGHGGGLEPYRETSAPTDATMLQRIYDEESNPRAVQFRLSWVWAAMRGGHRKALASARMRVHLAHCSAGAVSRLRVLRYAAALRVTMPRLSTSGKHLAFSIPMEATVALGQLVPCVKSGRSGVAENRYRRRQEVIRKASRGIRPDPENDFMALAKLGVGELRRVLQARHGLPARIECVAESDQAFSCNGVPHASDTRYYGQLLSLVRRAGTMLEEPENGIPCRVSEVPSWRTVPLTDASMPRSGRPQRLWLHLAPYRRSLDSPWTACRAHSSDGSTVSCGEAARIGSWTGSLLASDGPQGACTMTLLLRSSRYCYPG